MVWEQPWAVLVPLSTTKSPAKTHRRDQPPQGSKPPDTHQPGGRSSPNSPMMAWTRTESCVRRIRVGRLPFLKWGKRHVSACSGTTAAPSTHTHKGSPCPGPRGLRHPTCLT